MSLALLAALSLAAAPPGPSAARAAMAQGRFDKALKLLDAQVAKVSEPAAFAALQLERAVCLKALGSEEKAEAAMVLALKRDPLAKLPDSDASPALLELYERAREQLPGKLRVAVDAEADLYVDGKKLAEKTVQMVFELVVGAHRVSAVRAGCGVGDAACSVEQQAVVKPGETAELKLVLPVPPPVKPPPEPQPVATVKPEPVKPEPVVVVQQPPPPPREPRGVAGPVGLFAGGVVVAGVSALGMAFSVPTIQAYRLQQDPTRPVTVTRDQTNRAVVLLTASVIGAAVGAVMLIAGLVMLASPDDEVKVSLDISPLDGRLTLALGWRF